MSELKAGDLVWIETDANEEWPQQREEAVVVLASPNGNFEALFHGYAGTMPLLKEDGEYRDLIRGQVVRVSKR
jgi:hypothetical protein